VDVASSLSRFVEGRGENRDMGKRSVHCGRSEYLEILYREFKANTHPCHYLKRTMQSWLQIESWHG
jgi:hypothetical protein